MGNFTNTTHKEVINSFVEASKDLLKNPYYAFSSLKATIVDYYNLDKNKSTLDVNLKTAYDNIGKNSPLRYNLVKDFFLYGLEKITYNLENTENGLEGSDIDGDAIILPNTLDPMVGDYFKIIYLNKQYLFSVNNAQPDTLENGANVWKISYKLERLLNKEEQNNIDICTVNKMVFIVNNAGTQFNTIIKESSYSLLEQLDTVDVSLKLYFKELFYSSGVQSFVFKYDDVQDSYMYDDFLIEFIIRNRLLYNDGNKYTHINHKLQLPKTFSVDYGESIYRVLETKSIEDIEVCKHNAVGQFIDDTISIFSMMSSNYFSLDYNTDIYLGSPDIKAILTVLPDEVIHAISDTLLFEKGTINEKYNIIIKYFNDQDILPDDIEVLENIRYKENGYSLYFLIPMLIFCIEKYIKKLLK